MNIYKSVYTVFQIVLAELVSVRLDFSVHLTAVATFKELGGEPDCIEVGLGLGADFLGTCLGIVDLSTKCLVNT